MSVRKRTWTGRNGETKTAWVVDYVDGSGKRRLKTFERKKDADAVAATTKVEVRQGTHTADSVSVTVERAADLWIASCEANGLERTTVDAYRQHVRLHINPFLGRVRLSQLTAPMVREFEDSLRIGRPASGQETGAARSPAMVKRIIGSLGALIANAQEEGRVARNVVRDLRSRRKGGKERSAEKRHKGRARAGVDIPLPEEIKGILAASQGRWRPLLITAVFTGLRASELRGLRWSDVDLVRRELHVRQRADRFNVIGPPKTDAGYRSIPLPPSVVSELHDWKLLCPKGELDLVFPTGKGAPEHFQNILTRGFMPAQVRAGVVKPKTRKDGSAVLDDAGKPVIAAKYGGLHALRHFYASLCINREQDGGLGLTPKMVQTRMGHSSITMTMDVYGHLFPQGEDMHKLDAVATALIA